MNDISTTHSKCVVLSNMFDNVRYTKPYLHGLYLIPLQTNALRKPFMSSHRFPTFVEHPVTVIQQVQIDMLGLVKCTLQNACIPVP